MMGRELSLQPLSTEHLFEGSQEPDGTQSPRTTSSTPLVSLTQPLTLPSCPGQTLKGSFFLLSIP